VGYSLWSPCSFSAPISRDHLAKVSQNQPGSVPGARSRTRQRRLSLVAGHALPPEPERRPPPEPQHLDSEQPGHLVQLDCFHIGRLTGTKGRVWQYSAIDVASSFVWAEVHVTDLNPSAKNTSAFAFRRGPI
jgi:hypothetical protein